MAYLFILVALILYGLKRAFEGNSWEIFEKFTVFKMLVK